MKHKKQAFFFLNPYFLVALLLVIIIAVIGPKIATKLEMIGIADDYLIYDDFSKGFLEEDLWDVSGNYLVSSRGLHPYNSVVLTTKRGFDGNYFKFKFSVGSIIYSSRLYVSTFDAYIDDKLIISESPRGGYGYTIVLEGIPSFENPELYTIRINAEDYVILNTSAPGDGKLQIALTRQFYRVNSDDPDYQGSYTDSTLYYLKYKFPYNCKINDDEILLFDSFSAGSTVNISSLSYEPVKFCLDYPIKARSFDENGIKTDIRGEILQKIVRGESTVMPENEEWKVYYITKLTPDISLRCDIDEAYNTATEICENPNEKIVVGCKSKSDCYIPPGCTGVTCNCLDNGCEYQGACIFKPQKESSGFWERIWSISFFQWIQNLWN